MAARRGKSQARRNQGNGGLPGWAWGVLGLLLGVGLFFAAPKLLKSDGDGFFRPRPNPDAQPAPVAMAEDDVAPEGDTARGDDDARPATKAGADKEKSPEYDFYTLLPGKEVALSDAELAATERAETQRAATQAAAAAQTSAADGASPVSATAGASQPTLPRPVDAGNDTAAPSPPEAAVPPVKPASATASATVDNTRYLLQAGAFQASGQAEELKAKIALLGLGARVESASLGGKTVYRVRMGPYGTAGDLAEAKRKLASGGLPGLAIKVK
jgi:cell division protein FtsN